MDVEKAVLEFLGKYGSIREQDVLRYVKNKFGYSDRGIKKLIQRMEMEKDPKKKIFRIVIVELKPPAVYLSAKEYVPHEILKEMIRARAQVQAAELRAYAGGERT